MPDVVQKIDAEKVTNTSSGVIHYIIATQPKCSDIITKRAYLYWLSVCRRYELNRPKQMICAAQPTHFVNDDSE